MGKYEKGTPKEIANRCKSKGLQKLRWFCQMCQKQCRDQNGFKCHLMSEAHQRQLLLFAENPDTYLKEYSEQFEKAFLTVLRNTFGTKRVRANEVYQEYIRDKMHVHMNSTTWHTLTNFVLYLGSSGKCRIDQTEKGWFIALVDQEEEMRKQEAAHKAKADHDDEERQQQLLEQRVERARERLRDEEGHESGPSKLQRTDNDDKIAFSLAPKKAIATELVRPTTSAAAYSSSIFEVKTTVKKEEIESDKPSSSKKMKYSDTSEKRTKFNDDDRMRRSEKEVKKEIKPGAEGNSKHEETKTKRSALDEIREMEERKKERQNRKDYWLHEGIIVKVMTKKLGTDFYKSKGVVKSLVDEYTALVDVDGAVVKVDQEHVETVIPAVGRHMLIVNGAYRNTKAVLESVNERDFSVTLRLDEGHAKGRVISVPYEDASKLA
uniref:DNA/RNA-binding protein Kin17 WH-like domain-containing protein n=1 Tax=Ascaris lumbricoides TaxID=6252 RepID=A0A9J2PRM0_ASCLU